VLKVTIDSSYKTERILGSMYATLEVPVTITGLPFWRTKYTTQACILDNQYLVRQPFQIFRLLHQTLMLLYLVLCILIEALGFDAIAEKFGMADGLNIDYPKYTFTENKFTVWNGGNVTVDPRNMDLKIRLFRLKTDGNFKLTNHTTGETFN
jgi:hypothetical protein